LPHRLDLAPDALDEQLVELGALDVLDSQLSQVRQDCGAELFELLLLQVGVRNASLGGWLAGQIWLD